MKKQTKKELILLLCLAIPFASVITYGFIGIKKEDEILKNNPRYTKGIIIETRRGYKSQQFAKYEFVVDGIKYRNAEKYMPHKEDVMAGDTCEVVYAASNPKINKLLTHGDKTLILHHPRLENIQRMKRIRNRINESRKDSLNLFD